MAADFFLPFFNIPAEVTVTDGWQRADDGSGVSFRLPGCLEKAALGVKNVTLIWQICLQWKMFLSHFFEGQSAYWIIQKYQTGKGNRLQTLQTRPVLHTACRLISYLIAGCYIVTSKWCWDSVRWKGGGGRMGGEGGSTHLRCYLSQKTGAAAKCSRIDNFVKLPVALWGLAVSCRTS